MLAMSMTQWFQTLAADYGSLLWQGVLDTIYMTVFSTVIAYIFGLPLGILSTVTSQNGINPMPVLNKIVGWIINIGRSIPFIILLIAIMPLTRIIVGTSLGPTAANVALVISATPFIARLVENSLNELDGGIIEAARAMGANDWQIICKVMLPESLPSLILGGSLGAITIAGYTAMAGAVGGGGLGDIAIRYGYYRSETHIAVITIIILVVIVQIIQGAGEFVADKVDKRRKGVR